MDRRFRGILIPLAQRSPRPIAGDSPQGKEIPFRKRRPTNSPIVAPVSLSRTSLAGKIFTLPRFAKFACGGLSELPFGRPELPRTHARDQRIHRSRVSASFQSALFHPL